MIRGSGSSFAVRSSRPWVRFAAISIAFTLAMAFAPTAFAAGESSASGLALAQVASIVSGHQGARQVDRQAMAVGARSEGASLDAIGAIAAASGCWTDGGYVEGRNVLGWTLFRYNEEHDWCGSGGFITYKHVTTWPSNLFVGWDYKGDVKTSQWGVGWNVWKEHLSGHFCLINYFGCVANSYPWIEYYVGGDGSTYYWRWG